MFGENQVWPYLPYNWTGHCCSWPPLHWPSKCLVQKLAHTSWQINNFSEHTRSLTLNIFGCYCLYYICWIWLQCPLHTWPQGYCERGVGQDCKGHAGYIGVGCVVKPLNIAVLGFSVHSLPNQCLLHLYLMHMTALPTGLLPSPSWQLFLWKGCWGMCLY